MNVQKKLQPLMESVMAKIGAQHFKQRRKEVNAAKDYASFFHVNVEEWKDRDVIVPQTAE